METKNSANQVPWSNRDLQEIFSKNKKALHKSIDSNDFESFSVELRRIAATNKAILRKLNELKISLNPLPRSLEEKLRAAARIQNEELDSKIKSIDEQIKFLNQLFTWLLTSESEHNRKNIIQKCCSNVLLEFLREAIVHLRSQKDKSSSFQHFISNSEHLIRSAFSRFLQISSMRELNLRELEAFFSLLFRNGCHLIKFSKSSSTLSIARSRLRNSGSFKQNEQILMQFIDFRGRMEETKQNLIKGLFTNDSELIANFSLTMDEAVSCLAKGLVPRIDPNSQIDVLSFLDSVKNLKSRIHRCNEEIRVIKQNVEEVRRRKEKLKERVSLMEADAHHHIQRRNELNLVIEKQLEKQSTEKIKCQESIEALEDFFLKRILLRNIHSMDLKLLATAVNLILFRQTSDEIMSQEELNSQKFKIFGSKDLKHRLKASLNLKLKLSDIKKLKSLNEKFRSNEDDYVTFCLKRWLNTLILIDETIKLGKKPKILLEQENVEINMLIQEIQCERRSYISLENGLKGNARIVLDLKKGIRTLEGDLKLASKAFPFLCCLKSKEFDSASVFEISSASKSQNHFKTFTFCFDLFQLGSQAKQDMKLKAVVLIQALARVFISRNASILVLAICHLKFNERRKAFLHEFKEQQRVFPNIIQLIELEIKMPKRKLLSSRFLNLKSMQPMAMKPQISKLVGFSDVASILAEKERFKQTGKTNVDPDNQTMKKFSGVYKGAIEMMKTWSQNKQKLIEKHRKQVQILSVKKRNEIIDKEFEATCMELSNVFEYKEIEGYLQSGVDLRAQWKNGHSALTYFSRTGSKVVTDDHSTISVVSFILDSMKHISQDIFYCENQWGRTALMEAVMQENLEITNDLISRGSNPEYKSMKDDLSALELASKFGKKESIRFLLSRKIDTNYDNAENLAMQGNHLDVIKLLRLRRNGAELSFSYDGPNELFRCRNGCGEYFVDAKLSDHEEFKCNKRTRECPLNCGTLNLLISEVDDHLRDKCSESLIRCENDCNEEVKRKRMKIHLKSLCSHRIVKCELCSETLKAKEINAHSKDECSERLVECSNLCGETMMFRNLRNHLKQSCRRRKVRCRMNPCITLLEVWEQESHEARCLCRRKECSLQCGKEMQALKLIEHEINQCPLRLVSCPNKCGSKIPHQSVDQHQKHDCRRRFVPCALNCGLKVQPEFRSSHETNECTKRIIKCNNEGCIEMGLSELMPNHENDCLFKLVQCTLGCNQKIQRKEMISHQIEKCPRRKVSCFEFAQQHREDQSTSGCLKYLPLDSMQFHRDYECRNRLINCANGCGQVLVAKLQSKHNQSCTERDIVCLNECGVELKLWQMNSHNLVCKKSHVHRKYTSREEVVEK